MKRSSWQSKQGNRCSNAHGRRLFCFFACISLLFMLFFSSSFSPFLPLLVPTYLFFIPPPSPLLIDISPRPPLSPVNCSANIGLPPLAMLLSWIIQGNNVRPSSTALWDVELESKGPVFILQGALGEGCRGGLW